MYMALSCVSTVSVSSITDCLLVCIYTVLWSRCTQSPQDSISLPLSLDAHWSLDHKSNSSPIIHQRPPFPPRTPDYCTLLTPGAIEQSNSSPIIHRQPPFPPRTPDYCTLLTPGAIEQSNSSPIIHQQTPFPPQFLTHNSPATTLSSPWPDDCTLLTPRALRAVQLLTYHQGQANKTHRTYVEPILGRRRRRRANIGSTLGRCVVWLVLCVRMIGIVTVGTEKENQTLNQHCFNVSCLLGK